MKNPGLKLLALTALTLGILAPAHAALAQDGTDVNPIDDLAGVLLPNSSDTSTGTLYTTPNEQDQVLASLQAVPIGNNQYQTSVTGSTITFSPIPVLYPPFYLPPGELICQTNMVRVYRNATCVMTFPGLGYPCSPYGSNWADLNSLPVKQCKRGTGFCIEVKKVSWIRNIYFDNQCTQLIGVQTGTDFRCN